MRQASPAGAGSPILRERHFLAGRDPHIVRQLEIHASSFLARYASENAGFVTGQVIHVNGGQYMQTEQRRDAEDPRHDPSPTALQYSRNTPIQVNAGASDVTGGVRGEESDHVGDFLGFTHAL